jgi:hypothetical protein
MKSLPTTKLFFTLLVAFCLTVPAAKAGLGCYKISPELMESCLPGGKDYDFARDLLAAKNPKQFSSDYNIEYSSPELQTKSFMEDEEYEPGYRDAGRFEEEEYIPLSSREFFIVPPSEESDNESFDADDNVTDYRYAETTLQFD